MQKINIYDESNIYLSELRQISNKNKASIKDIKHIIYKLFYRYGGVKCCSNVKLNSFNYAFNGHSKKDNLPENFPKIVGSNIQTIHLDRHSESIPEYIIIADEVNFNHRIPVRNVVDSIKGLQQDGTKIVIPSLKYECFSEDKIKIITNFINLFIDNYDCFNTGFNWRDKILTQDVSNNVILKHGYRSLCGNSYTWWCWESSLVSGITVCGYPVDFLYKYQAQDRRLSYYFKFIHTHEQTMTDIKNVRLLRKNWFKNLNLRFSILPKDVINIIGLHLLDFVLTDLNRIINELYITKYTEILKKK
jgi:hypothetical protein